MPSQPTLEDAIRAVKELLSDWSAQLPQSHTCNAHDWVEQKAIVALRDTILPALESVSQQDKSDEVLNVARDMLHDYTLAAQDFQKAQKSLEDIIENLRRNGLIFSTYSGIMLITHFRHQERYANLLRAIEKERA